MRACTTSVLLSVCSPMAELEGQVPSGPAVVSPAPMDCGFSLRNCNSILPRVLSNSWGTLADDHEQQTFLWPCSRPPSPRTGPPAGVELSALCPVGCRPPPRPTCPTGDCHHAAGSEHRCLAETGSRCGSQAPATLGSSGLGPLARGQLRAAVLTGQKGVGSY